MPSNGSKIPVFFSEALSFNDEFAHPIPSRKNFSECMIISYNLNTMVIVVPLPCWLSHVVGFFLDYLQIPGFFFVSLMVGILQQDFGVAFYGCKRDL